jgi:eukaryotic-like serine/threonine-protein kinase
MRAPVSDEFQRLGRYLLIDPLSSGGMGHVHLAIGPDGMPCVIKRMLDENASTPEMRRRFAREAALSRRLSHSNLIRCLDDGKVDGERFIVQEYVRGADLALLQSRIGTQGGTLPISVCAHIVSLVCRGLHCLHEMEDGSFIHRDVTPSNIQIAMDGEVKLLDFGLAKSSWDVELTRPGSTFGKLVYMSPEHVAGKTLDRRADVYSVGAVLWELCTGGRLLADHMESKAEDTARRLLNGAAPPPSDYNPDVPKVLDALILKALAKDRNDRLGNARELATAIAPFAVGGRQALATIMQQLFYSAAGEARLEERLAEARKKIGIVESAMASKFVRTERIKDQKRSRFPLWIYPIAGLLLAAGGAMAVALRNNQPEHDFSVRAAAVPPSPTAATTASVAPVPPAIAPVPSVPPTLLVPPDEPLREGASVETRKRRYKLDPAAPASAATPEAPVVEILDPPTEAVATNNDAFASKAQQAFDDGDFVRAAAWARDAIAAGSNAFPVLGAAEFKLGHYAEAEIALTEALGRAPGNPVLLRQLGAARKLARGGTP